VPDTVRMSRITSVGLVTAATVLIKVAKDTLDLEPGMG
jgi:hypothetical protein